MLSFTNYSNSGNSRLDRAVDDVARITVGKYRAKPQDFADAGEFTITLRRFPGVGALVAHVGAFSDSFGSLQEFIALDGLARIEDMTFHTVDDLVELLVDIGLDEMDTAELS